MADFYSAVDTIGSYRVSRANRDVPDADEIVPDYFPAAVSADLYAKAQRMRRQRPSKGRKGTTFSNLFTGMGVCEHCFGSMVVKVGGYVRRPTKYLQCYNHQRRLGCQHGNRSFRYQDLEDVILNTLTEYALSDLFHNRALEQEAAGLADLHIPQDKKMMFSFSVTKAITAMNQIALVVFGENLRDVRKAREQGEHDRH